MRNRSPHLPLGSVVGAQDRASGNDRARVRRHGHRGRRGSAQRHSGRLRLRREPRHMRDMLLLPHGPGAHVRAHENPRRRPRRRSRRLRRVARVGRLAERPLETLARDSGVAGALRQCGVRHRPRRARRQGRRGARVRPRRALRHSDCPRLGRGPRPRFRPDAVSARARTAPRRGVVGRGCLRGRPRLVPRAQRARGRGRCPSRCQGRRRPSRRRFALCETAGRSSSSVSPPTLSRSRWPRR